LANLKPKNVVTLYTIASLYKKRNDFKNAAKFFSKVVIDKKTGQEGIRNRAYYHLGEISLNMGKTAKAVDYFGLCLKSNPKHHKANQHLTNISTHSI